MSTRYAALAFLLTALASTAHADSVATLGETKGDVKVNQGSQFVQGQPGQALNAGDRILVMEGGETYITFSDGCKKEIEGGTLVTVPSTSTCKGGLWSSQQIAPADGGAIGAADAGTSYATVNGVGWTWIGVAAACFIWCRTEDNGNTVSP